MTQVSPLKWLIPIFDAIFQSIPRLMTMRNARSTLITRAWENLKAVRRFCNLTSTFKVGTPDSVVFPHCLFIESLCQECLLCISVLFLLTKLSTRHHRNGRQCNPKGIPIFQARHNINQSVPDVSTFFWVLPPSRNSYSFPHELPVHCWIHMHCVHAMAIQFTLQMKQTHKLTNTMYCGAKLLHHSHRCSLWVILLIFLLWPSV
jgi:hypothetical protein